MRSTAITLFISGLNMEDSKFRSAEEAALRLVVTSANGAPISTPLTADTSRKGYFHAVSLFCRCDRDSVGLSGYEA